MRTDTTYDEIVRETGDAIVEAARRRAIDSEYVASRMGWTLQAATTVLRRLVKAGRLDQKRNTRVSWRSGANLDGYQVGRVTYTASETHEQMTERMERFAVDGEE